MKELSKKHTYFNSLAICLFALLFYCCGVSCAQLVGVETLLFASDSYRLQQKHKQQLDSCLQLIADNPLSKIVIAGHTDTICDFSYNLRLSERRMNSVCRYFVEHGIDSSRISVSYHAYKLAIANNRNETGRQRNRRVEISITNLTEVSDYEQDINNNPIKHLPAKSITLSTNLTIKQELQQKRRANIKKVKQFRKPPFHFDPPCPHLNAWQRLWVRTGIIKRHKCITRNNTRAKKRQFRKYERALRF